MTIVLYSEEDDRFYQIEFSAVDNGGKYPGSFTKKEYLWLKEYTVGHCLHIFSGSSCFGDVRVDLSHENATVHQDVFDFLEGNNEEFDTVILDPPYNARFAEQYAKISQTDMKKQFIIFAQSQKTTQFFNLLIHLAPRRIIMKSWNWYIVKGYKIHKAYLCYAGGYRKPTFFLILEKKDFI